MASETDLTVAMSRIESVLDICSSVFHILELYTALC